MFSLEIEFHDGISAPETVFIRRASAIVGSSDQAHVVIEGIPSSSGELRIVRGVGREFRCQPVRRTGTEGAAPSFLEGTYRGTAELKLGDVTLRITALDVDFCFAHEESPDSAAVRILQRALSKRSPIFPALAVNGAQPVMLSFAPDQPLLIGRSRKCGLRFDASDVSSEHARVGVENGELWIEDLGSTNGTFVESERVSGRTLLQSNSVIQIGSEFLLSPVLNAEDVSRYGISHGQDEAAGTLLENSYPCIITDSETVKPQRLPFRASGEITIGRDPANDIWINAPHISRQHLSIHWSPPEQIHLVDHSSNGTFIETERLVVDQVRDVDGGLTVLDFCSGITLAICRSERDEQRFRSKSGVGKSVRGASKFKEDEPSLESYRGSKIDNWADIDDLDETDVPAGVFEKLAERHSNFAVPKEGNASEVESVDEDLTSDIENFKFDEISTDDGGPNGSETEFEPLAGVLEERENSRSAGDLRTGAESEFFDAAEYEGMDLSPSRGARLQKILLMSLIVGIFGFCMMLVFGFFSDSYF